MDPDNIPEELRKLPNWVSFKIGPDRNPVTGKLIKTPFIPGTDRKASPMNEKDWRSFEEAAAHGVPALAITRELGLILIDLDGDGKTPIKEALMEQIMETFPGYQELSSSQAGVHILVYGKMSSPTGLHRQNVEMYSHSRFCIFTGNVIEGQDHIQQANPTALQWLEEEMMTQMEVQAVDLVELPEREADKKILEDCQKKFGVKFTYLYTGAWQKVGEYPSQSEADHALIGMLADLTYTNSQVKRLFEKSALYRPKKARDYVKYSLLRIRANQQREASNLEFIEIMLKKARPLQIRAKVETDFSRNDPRVFDVPDGLLLEFYQTYMRIGRYAVREAALIAAMVTALSLFQRRYQTHTRLALNMWLFLLGPAGAGKEIINQGPSRLFKMARADMPGVFGGEFRSSPAVEEALKDSLRHCAYHPECGSWLKALCSENSGVTWQQLRTKLTDSYTKGNDVMTLRQVKREKGAPKPASHLVRPCLTIYGECVAEDFYTAVGTGQVAGGFIPRFSVMEIDRDTIPLDANDNDGSINRDLLENVHRLAANALVNDITDENAEPHIVGITQEARSRFNAFVRETRERYIKGAEGLSVMEGTLLSRAGEKISKVATLLAVCRDQHDPRVILDDIEWAILFVRVTDGRMTSQLVSGEFDTAAHHQRDIVANKLLQAYLLPTEQRETGKNAQYFKTKQLCRAKEAVPYGWLSEKVRTLNPFKHDKRGFAMALDAALRDMMNSGEIIVVDGQLALEKFGTRGKVILDCREAAEFSL